VTLKRASLVIAFVAIFLVGDRVIASLLDTVLLRSGLRFSILYSGGRQYQILILGNSCGVNTFYAPAIQEATGMSTLNLSYNGMSADVAEALFLDYLDRNRQPKLLIIEITNITHRSELLNDLKLYAPHSERLMSILRANNPEAARWVQISHLFRFNSEMFLRALYYQGVTDQTWINRYQINRTLLNSAANGNSHELKTFPENLAAMKRIVSHAQSLGISVRVVVGPYLPAYGKSLSNMHRWVREVEKEMAGGISIRDYSDAISDVSAFADRMHLNYEGSCVLLKRLIRDGVFTASPPQSLASSGNVVPNARQYD
jgi:hypothetical protein